MSVVYRNKGIPLRTVSNSTPPVKWEVSRKRQTVNAQIRILRFVPLPRPLRG